MLHRFRGVNVLFRCGAQGFEGRDLELHCLRVVAMAMQRGQGEKGVEQRRGRRRVPGQRDADDDVPQLGGIAPEGGKGFRGGQLDWVCQPRS
jgi:hypothetical protein